MIFSFVVGELLEFDYTNYKGEFERRMATFKRLQYGSNDYHPEPCWLILCHDIKRNASRSFDVSKITNLRIGHGT